MAPTKPRESKNTLQEVRIRHALEERRLEDTSFRKLADKYGVSSSTLSDRELFFFFFCLFITRMRPMSTMTRRTCAYVQSVSPLQSAFSGTVQASLCPPPKPDPRKYEDAPMNYKGKGQRKDVVSPPPLLLLLRSR